MQQDVHDLMPRLVSLLITKPTSMPCRDADEDVELLAARLKDRRSAAESVFNALRRAEQAANAAAQVLLNVMLACSAQFPEDWRLMENASQHGINTPHMLWISLTDGGFSSSDTLV